MFFFLQALSFQQSKKTLKQFYKKHPTTLYCPCEIQESKVLCQKKSYALEWEHIVPVSYLTQQKSQDFALCEQKKIRGRRCLQMVDKEFIKFEADMHNIIPESSYVNRKRSNLPFKEKSHWFYSKKNILPQCALKIQKDRVLLEGVERGFIARAYLYMQKTYGYNLMNQEELKQFTSWDQLYPAQGMECERNQFIKQKQGNSNPFIDYHCEKKERVFASLYPQRQEFIHPKEKFSFWSPWLRILQKKFFGGR